MMRPRRRLDTEEQEALKEAIRESFKLEEQKRDAEFDAAVIRLLKHLAEFERFSDA